MREFAAGGRRARLARCLALALLGPALALAGTASAQAPAPTAPAALQPVDKLHYVEGGMLVLFVPTYPKEALARGETATLTVSGTIQTDGRLEDLRFEGDALSPSFETEVRRAAQLWRLQPRIVPPGCGATETPGKVTIWFEIEGGQPKVSYGVSRPAQAEAAPQIHKDRAPLRSVKPQYPRRLMTDPNVPRTVLQIAYVGVSADGDVINVTLAPALYYREFEPLIAAAMRQWKYAPQAGAWCGEVAFHMTLE